MPGKMWVLTMTMKIAGAIQSEDAYYPTKAECWTAAHEFTKGDLKDGVEWKLAGCEPALVIYIWDKGKK